MPGYDKTGPQGMGPMSGRGKGQCNTANRNNFSRETGFGMGRCRGFRNNFQNALPNETLALQDVIKAQQTELNSLKQRLNELDIKLA